MGEVVSKLSERCTEGVSSLFVGNRKRRLCVDSKDAGADENHQSQAPDAKKKKLLTTTQYIYQALFKEQKNSDVAVMAMGKVWNLHKIYLSQSPYFHSMFNGSWRESCEQFVHIQIEDERIGEEALDAVFGSLYSDEITITSQNVISILATATLFHMDSIIERCAEVMIENINKETAIDYYECACQYGCINVKKKTFEWLEMNLLQMYSKDRISLKQISISLMTSLVLSSDLFVMQTEFSLYVLLRTWIYLRLNVDYDPDQTQSQLAQQQQDNSNADSDDNNTNMPVDLIRSYFATRPEGVSFLATNEGQQYIKPFQALRTQYLATHHMDLKIVLTDNIIPKEWLHSHVMSHWNAILKVDHSPDEGPQNLEPDVFFANCMRCARSLPEPGYQKWRWTGFNFGLDLILILDSRMLRIRRHHRNENERLLSLQTQRQFMIRVVVASINAHRQLVRTQKSEILSLSLEKNEEATVLILDQNLLHPLLISVNLLVVPPTVQTVKEQMLLPPPCEDVGNSSLPISEIGTDYQGGRPPHGCTAVCDVSVSPSTSSVTDSSTSIRQSHCHSALRPPIPLSSVIVDSSDAYI